MVSSEESSWILAQGDYNILRMLQNALVLLHMTVEGGRGRHGGSADFRSIQRSACGAQVLSDLQNATVNHKHLWLY